MLNRAPGLNLSNQNDAHRLVLAWLCSSVALASCLSDEVTQPHQSRPSAELIVISDPMGHSESWQGLREQEADEILLSRFLDVAATEYRFENRPVLGLTQSDFERDKILISSDFDIPLPKGWISTLPFRYTSDVIVGEVSDDGPGFDSEIHYFEGTELEWIRDTQFAPLRRTALKESQWRWTELCYSSEIKHYLVVPKAYLDTIVRRCPHWSSLARNPESRPVRWHGSPATSTLIRDLNLALTELKMTGHRHEVHHDSWESLKTRKVIRIAAERSPFTYFLERGAESGLGFELLAWFAGEWKLRTEFYPVDDVAEGLKLLRGGQADLLLSLESAKSLVKDTSITRAFHDAKLALVSAGDNDEQATKSWAIDASLDDDLISSLQSSHFASAPLRVHREHAVDFLEAGTSRYFVTSEPLSHWFKSLITSLQIDEYDSEIPEGGVSWVFGVRSSAHGLKQALDQFIEKERGSLIWNVIRNKYLRQVRRIGTRSSSENTLRRKIPYEEKFRFYAVNKGFDWRLIAAQAQVESGFNAEAVSWVGARGILQVMPATARELGIDNLHRVENGLEAGVKYLDWLMNRFESSLDYRQRLRFALAAYNIGLGHVRDARRLATGLGLDPNRWFGNVEKAMLKLREPRYFKNARYGYCRGGEAVAYVSKIQTLYDVYVQSYLP